MSLSESLNQFKIPMLGKFLGGAEQNTHGSFIEGEVYVITAYNPHNNTVQTTGNTSRNRWIDEVAFEVVRNASWSFAEGHCAPHLEAASDFTNDLAKFEDPCHDDHIEALSFDHRVWMGIDLANSPDYSVTGRYVGGRWPDMPTILHPARPLAADENQHKILSHDFTSLEQAARTYARKGKSRANAMFHYATGKAEFLALEHKERRFAELDGLRLRMRSTEEGRAMLKEKFEAIQYSANQEVSPTDEICDAFLAVQRLMQVPDALLAEKPRYTADTMRGLNFNCRCVVNDVPYVVGIEDGKPTYSKPFLPKLAKMSDKFEKTMRARLERSMNHVHIHTSAVDDRPLTNTNITSDPFTMSEAPKKANAPDFPLESELVEETTFVHKSATRKTQEIHEENDGTADLRKYRFNPEA